MAHGVPLASGSLVFFTFSHRSGLSAFPLVMVALCRCRPQVTAGIWFSRSVGPRLAVREIQCNKP